MAAGFMTHVTCRLTAKNRDQLRNPTLGNRVWTAFTFFYPPLTYYLHLLLSLSVTRLNDNCVTQFSHFVPSVL